MMGRQRPYGGPTEVGRRSVSGRPVLLPLAVAMMAACGEAVQADLLRQEVLDGVPHSVAADRPEWRDATLDLLWEAPAADEVLDGADWADPTQLAANERGVVVLDPQLSRIHVFTAAGDRQGSIGRRGEGPGEISRPMGLGVHGDTIMVHDGTRPAIQLFSRVGEYLGDFAAVEGMSFGFYHLEGVGVLRSSIMPAPGQAQAPEWVLVGYDGERRSLTLPGDHPLQPHVREGETGCWRRSGAGGHLLETDCTFPLIRVVSPAGRVVREHRLEREPRESSAEALAAMAESVRRTMSQLGDRAPAALIEGMVDRQVERNRWLPVFRMVTATDSGERLVLWEQLPDDLGGGDAVLHLLDGDGRYLVRQEMGEPYRSIAATGDRLYVLAMDAETGLKRLRAYRLP